jgi:hypothetical protein
MSDDEYDVGYKKPPKNSRFRQGQSGNPRGRPKGAQNLNSRLMAALNERVTVVEGGKRKTMTKYDALVKQVVNKAAGGDVRFTKLTFEMIDAVESKVPLNHRITVELVEAVDGRPVRRLLSDLSGYEELNPPAGVKTKIENDSQGDDSS